MESSSLYEKDFYAWTRYQAKLIKGQTLDQLDLVHLFEEVEDMGNRHADEIESRLTILLMHLLKWKYQPNLQSKSWAFTIKEQRRAITKRLKKMPSLKTKMNELFLEAYDDAIFEAEKEIWSDLERSQIEVSDKIHGLLLVNKDRNQEVGYMSVSSLDESIFPTACLWTIEQTLDNDFFP